jgi:uncharacterized pyridoxamine 5'-phosphate oxidase family protein
MKKVIEFLNENINGDFATVEGEKPKVRPFQFMFEEDGKFYFCTANNKQVYRQLMTNPNAEFSSTSPKFAWVRLSGEVKFTDDIKIKERIIEHSGMVKSVYKTADNPIFEAFYIEHGSAVLSDFSGQPPTVIEF